MLWGLNYYCMIITLLDVVRCCFLQEFACTESNVSSFAFMSLNKIKIPKFHCFTVHFDSLSFIHTNSCTFSYNYVSVFILKSLKHFRKHSNMFRSSMRSSSGSSIFTSLSMLLILKIIKIFKKYYQSNVVIWQHMFSMPVIRTVWRLMPPHSMHYRHTKHMLPHNHDGW